MSKLNNIPTIIYTATESIIVNLTISSINQNTLTIYTESWESEDGRTIIMGSSSIRVLDNIPMSQGENLFAYSDDTEVSFILDHEGTVLDTISNITTPIFIYDIETRRTAIGNATAYLRNIMNTTSYHTFLISGVIPYVQLFGLYALGDDSILSALNNNLVLTSQQKTDLLNILN